MSCTSSIEQTVKGKTMAHTNRGDRIIQMILLLLIAGGISAMIMLNINSNQPIQNGPGPGRPGGSASGGRNNERAPASAHAVAVETYAVQRSDVFEYIRVNGDVMVKTSVEIYADTNGQLVNLPIELGDTVYRNQIIGSVDPSLPGQNYSVSIVSSTISGTVISLPLQVGDKVSTSIPIATIGDLDDMVIQTYIPEKFISSLVEGLAAEVSFDAYPGESFKARITEINPVMDVSTRTLSVKLALDQNDPRIRPGMFSSMKLITRESLNTLSVPAQAVLSYYGDPSLYVINEHNQAERRLVKTGLITDDRIEITAGLREGEIVITQGQNKLTDGTAVRTVSLERS